VAGRPTQLKPWWIWPAEEMAEDKGFFGQRKSETYQHSKRNLETLYIYRENGSAHNENGHIGLLQLPLKHMKRVAENDLSCSSMKDALSACERDDLCL